LMKYYAHFGHTEFILCLGYRGDMIKKYFLHYDECLSNDFVLSKGGREVKPLNTDIQDWTITFVETGLHSNIGQRLSKVRQFVEKDEIFMANYSDGLSDLPLDVYLNEFKARDAVASLAAMHSSQSFHAVTTSSDGSVASIGPVQTTAGYAINGGYFLFALPTALHENNGLTASGMAIYPNPATNKVFISGLMSGAFQQSAISLYNLSRQLCSVPVIYQNGIAEVDISHLSSGIYSIQIQSGETVIRKKLLVR